MQTFKGRDLLTLAERVELVHFAASIHMDEVQRRACLGRQRKAAFGMRTTSSRRSVSMRRFARLRIGSR